MSKAVRRTDGGLDFTSGPLKRLAELEALRSVLVRERRATAALPLHGIEHKIKLSFEIEQETGSSDGAGSPPEAKAGGHTLTPEANRPVLPRMAKHTRRKSQIFGASAHGPRLNRP